MKLLTVLVVSLIATFAYGENYWKLGVDPLSFQNHEDVLVYLDDGTYEVAAFVLDGDAWECRGVQSTSENGVRTLLVYGNDGEEVFLRVWNLATNEFEPRQETFYFDSSKALLEIDMNGTTGIKALKGSGAANVSNGYACDLAGRRIANASNKAGSKKIIIVNGKKYAR